MDGPLRTRPAPDLADLAQSLGFLLRLAQLRAFEDFFSEHGPRGLKPGEFSVLWVIGRNPGIRQSVVGQQLMIKRAHMTKLIRGFEDQQLVSRLIPDSDRRAVELTLTAKGMEEMTGAAKAFFAYESETGAPLNARERADLVRLLRKFVGMEETAP